MTRVLTIAALLLTFTAPAAQTKGRVSVGGTVTYVKPTDSAEGTEYGNQWKADAILLSVGAVYSLF
jgi:hypothetical protein